MAKEFKLSMVISARDDASKAITKAMRDSTKESQNAEKAQEKLSKRQRTTSEEGIRQNRALGEEIKRQNRARETLGIRAERAIQREIQQTVASYNRLARSGTLSIDEQSRAYERMRQRVSQLRVEMQGMNRLARVSDIAGSIAKAGGALVAGGMAVAPPVKKQMSYSRTLADMSNVAFNDRDIQGRIEGKKELDIIIQDSIAKGGGTKEEAANLLGGLLAKGVFEFEEIKELMPLLQQYSTATGVGGEELAKVTESLKEYGITSADEMMKVMDAAIRSGQEGSFEFSDMAKWLPEILSKAKAIGYSGSEDIVKLLAYSQGMMKNAPTADTAGNNFVNLLNKVSSQELATKAKAIKVDGYGIDMAGTLTQAQAKGIDPISALVGLTDVIARQNPEFRKLEEQLSKTDKNSPEYQKLLESQRRILESSAIGQLIADQQALMGLLAAREYRGYIKQVETESKKQLYLPKGEGEGYVSYGLIAQENDFKVQQAKEQSDFAEMGAVKPLSDSLGNLADKFTDFSKEFPGLTTAVMGAKTGIEAMTQAAIAFAALKFLFGGDGLPGVSGGKSSPLPTGAGAGAKSSGLFGRWGSLVGWSMIATELATLTSPEEDEAVMGSEERWKSIRANYPQSMIDAAREKYQPWYQFGEGYSTENEAWLQRYIKENGMPTFASGIAGNEIKNTFERNGIPKLDSAINNDVITYDTLEKSGVLQPLLDLTQALKNPPPPPVIEVRSVVELDGQQVAESVNRVNGQDAGRTTGGMFP
ncbi:phage tail tape measure protein [Providencia rettgeri]|uniref:phage tail tape measure protein n=1 Tax=Providencia rettgeri TaxID=587 RepID=UPI002940F8BF|nr:phage tail tape measure protein [Providencia rettgeri]ELR5224420.1 phage tail tape measure protein [Providencia rettgeri]MDX7324617.1 phage tail tape measure protein [Providencia rettgeri]